MKAKVITLKDKNKFEAAVDKMLDEVHNGSIQYRFDNGYHSALFIYDPKESDDARKRS